MRKRRTALSAAAFALLALRLPGVRAEGEPANRVRDVQVRSAAEYTEIELSLPAGVSDEDRTKTRPGAPAADSRRRALAAAEAREVAESEEPVAVETPTPGTTPEATPTTEPAAGAAPTQKRWATSRPGEVTIEEVRLFFPGASVGRARLVSINDLIVEEARLFEGEGGVTVTVTVRRPVFYTVARRGDVLRIRLEPAILLAAPREPEIEAPLEPESEARRGGRRPPSDRRGGAPARGTLAAPTVKVKSLEKGEGLTVDAENLTVDRDKNEVVAKGHVTIARAGSLVTADEMHINRETQHADARGTVQIVDTQGTVQADSFSGNIEDETGTLENATVYLESNHLTVSGEKLHKSFGQTYHIENGSFTTCRCAAGTPSWSISGKTIDVTLDGYGMVEGAKFKVLDVPVLYLPYVPFPAKVTRQSGLLAPLLGYSKKRGFTYTQPLYLVINKSLDATLSADIETEARIGGIGEIRYALDKESRGTLDASYFNESLRNNAERDIVNSDIADPDIPENRWSVTGNVRQTLPLDAVGFVDALAVSDDLFLREIPTFSFDPEYERMLRSSRFSTSRGGFYRLWDHATLIGEAVYYQDFIQEDDLTLQRLPQVSLFASQRVLGRHLKLRLDSEAVNFERRDGFDGPRADVFPRVEAPFHLGNVLRGSGGIGFRETAYHLNNTDVIEPNSQSGGVQATTDIGPIADNPTRELFQADARLATEVDRIFEVGGDNVQKLKHTIEPGVEYRYIPDVQQDDLPIYDFTDRIDRHNRFTYGITSRLLAKMAKPPPEDDRDRPLGVGDLNSFSGVAPAPFDDENTRGGLGAMGEEGLGAEAEEGEEEEAAEAPEAGLPVGQAERQVETEARVERLKSERDALSRVTEWGRIKLSQSYDLDTSLQPDRISHLSDFDAVLRVTPSEVFSLLFDSSVDATEQKLSAARVGFMLRAPRRKRSETLLGAASRASLGLAYRFIADGILEEVDAAIVVPLADTISAFYQSRYDALTKQFLENRGGFRLASQCRCWIIDLSVVDRINPNETELRAQVTLIGLGSIGRAR